VRLAVGGTSGQRDGGSANPEPALSLMERDSHRRYRRSHDGRIGVRFEGAAQHEAIVVREIATDTELLRLGRHEFLPRFSPDDRLLALALDDGLGKGPGLFMYRLDADPVTGESPAPGPHARGASLVFHRPDVVAVSVMAFSSDGGLAAIARDSDLSPIIIVETSTGRDLVGFRGQDGPRSGIVALAFNHDDSLLATGSADGTVRVWRADDGAMLSVMHGHAGAITGLAIVESGPGGPAAIITSSNDQTIRWWDATLATDPFVLRAPAMPYGLAFSPDGARLAAACLGGERPLLVWDVQTGGELLTALDGYGSAVAFSPDGAWIAMGRSHGPSAVISSFDGAVRSTIAPAGWRADWMEFGAGDELKWLSNGGHLIADDARTGERLRSKKFPAGDEAHGSRAASSPDGTLLFVACRRNIYMLDERTWESLGILRGSASNVLSIAFSPDGSRLVSGSADGVLRIWDVAAREEITSMSGHSGSVFAAVFSPDGSRIASAGRDRVVRIWDAARFEEITQLHGHTGLVYCLAFSPDGRTLASGGADDTVRLWGLDPRAVLASGK
jgi:WD40 repeat protein